MEFGYHLMTTSFSLKRIEPLAFQKKGEKKRKPMLKSVLTFFLFSICAHAQWPTLNMGCEMGQAPFNDAANHLENATSCMGLFSDVFMLACSRSNITYNLTMINTGIIDELLWANSTSGYDGIIAFHTVDPERLLLLQFSIVLYQTQMRIALRPEFSTTTANLEDSVIRASVLYLFSILAVIAFLAGLVMFVCEHFDPESELRALPLYHRLLYAAEQGFEIIMTSTTSLELNVQFSRSWRTLTALTALFLVQMFGAVITSQLTAASVGTVDIRLADLRGKKVAAVDPHLTNWLRLQGVDAYNTPNIETFAESFYGGTALAAGYDGFVGPEDIVVFQDYIYSGSANGFVVSTPFTEHGVHDFMALPFSKNLDENIVERLNVEFQRMRDDGELAALLNTHIVAYNPSGSNSDIPVPSTAFHALRWFVVSFYSLAVITAGTLYLKEKLSGDETEGDKEEGKGKGKGGLGPDGKINESQTEMSGTSGKGDILQWKGESYVVKSSLRWIVEGVIKNSEERRKEKQDGMIVSLGNS